MNISPASASPRVKVNALLSATEAAALEKLLGKLIEADYSSLADSEEEAAAFLEAASKMRRQLTAAEQLPTLPAYDD